MQRKREQFSDYEDKQWRNGNIRNVFPDFLDEWAESQQDEEENTLFRLPQWSAADPATGAIPPLRNLMNQLCHLLPQISFLCGI